MKRFLICAAIIVMLIPEAACAENAIRPTAVDYVSQSEIPQISEPYATLVEFLSNGKMNIREQLTIAANEALKSGNENIAIEKIAHVAAQFYTANPVQGLSKACLALSGWETLADQLRILTAFVNGYKLCGAAVMPINCYDKEPHTQGTLVAGNHAWFLIFKKGTTVKVNIYAKSEKTDAVRLWKIMPGRAIVKEWTPGFWEREIILDGKVQ